MGVSQFGGQFALTSYALTIFRESGSTIDPNISSVIMGLIQIVGTCSGSMLIDHLGRKVLLLISTAGSTIGLLIVSAYSYLHMNGFDVSDWNLLPIITISCFIFISAIGIIPVPYVITTEILPRKVNERIHIKFYLIVWFFFFFFLDKKSWCHFLYLYNKYICIYNATYTSGFIVSHKFVRMYVGICGSKYIWIFIYIDFHRRD